MIIVEHSRRNLSNVFDVLRERKIHTGIPERLAYGNTKDIKSKKHFKDVLPDQIATDNFSSIIVTGCLADEEERGFCSEVKDWSSGGGDTTIHIQTHFEVDPRFYEDMRRWSALKDFPKNVSKVKCVDDCECQAKNGEVGTSIKKREHSEHQIKPVLIVRKILHSC